MRNLVNFTGALKHLKICTFRDFFCSGYIRIQGIYRVERVTEELCVMTLKHDAISF